MPHIEIKHSNNLNLDYGLLFHSMEGVINEMDEAAGACKGRAYPASHYHHSHVLISVA